MHIHSTTEPEIEKVFIEKETTDAAVIETALASGSNAKLEVKKTEPIVASKTQNGSADKVGQQQRVHTSSTKINPSRVKPRYPNSSLKSAHKGINSLWFYCLIAMLPAILLFRQKVSQIDRWSQKNIHTGKWLIALFTLTGSASSFLLGAMFNWEISSLFAPISIGLISTALLSYWVKLKSGFNFLKKKLAIGLMSIAGLAGSFGLGIRNGSLFMNPITNDGGEMMLHPLVATLLTLLIVAALVASVYGLLAVACNIACSGYEVLAILFFLASSYLVTILAVFAVLHATKNVDEDTSDFWRIASLASVFIVIIGSMIFILV